MEEMGKKRNGKLNILEDGLEKNKEQMINSERSLSLKIAEMEKKMVDQIRENNLLKRLISLKNETISSLVNEINCVKEKIKHNQDIIHRVMKEKKEQKINSGSLVDSLKLPHPTGPAHLVSGLEASETSQSTSSSKRSQSTTDRFCTLPKRKKIFHAQTDMQRCTFENVSMNVDDDDQVSVTSPFSKQHKQCADLILVKNEVTVAYKRRIPTQFEGDAEGSSHEHSVESDFKVSSNASDTSTSSSDSSCGVTKKHCLSPGTSSAASVFIHPSEQTCLPEVLSSDEEYIPPANVSNFHLITNGTSQGAIGTNEDDSDDDEEESAIDLDSSSSDSSCSVTEKHCLSPGTSSAAPVFIHPSEQACLPEVSSSDEEYTISSANVSNFHLITNGTSQGAIGMNEDDNDDDEEDSVIDLDSFPPEIADDATCSNIVSALGTLSRINNDETAMKRSASQLKSALQNLDKLHESYAVQVTVNYITFRRGTPLQEYLQSNDPKVLFPLDELCIVKVYNTLGVPSLENKLEKAVYDMLLKHSEDLEITSLAALCRVSAAFEAHKNDVGKGKQLCYEVFKKFHSIAPFLVATIVSIFPEVLMPSSRKRSELRVHQAFCHLMCNKPNGLNEKLWDQTIFFLKKLINVEEIPSAEQLINCTINDIFAESNADNFSDQDTSNYILVFRLIKFGVDLLIYDSIIEKRVIAFISAFGTVTRKKLFSAAALFYKLLGIWGCGHVKSGMLYEIILNTCNELTNQKKIKVPDYIFQEIYYSMQRINARSEVITENEEGLKTWLKHHIRSKG